MGSDRGSGSNSLGSDRGTGSGAYGNKGAGASKDKIGNKDPKGSNSGDGGRDNLVKDKITPEITSSVTGVKSASEKFKDAQNIALEEVRTRAAASGMSSWRTEDFISSFMADQRGHEDFLSRQNDPNYKSATKDINDLSGRGETMQDLFPTPEWWNV